jgi:hypothetical protein
MSRISFHRSNWFPVFGRTLLIAVTLLLLNPGCEETLPPIPVEIAVEGATVAFRTDVSGLVVVHVDGSPNGIQGELIVSVRNLYEDVISDQEQVSVVATIIPQDSPGVAIVVQAGKEDVADQSMFLGDLLAIRPQQELQILKQWSHTTKDGDPLWAVVGIQDTVITPSGKHIPAYRVAVRVKVSIRLFKTRPTIYLDKQLVLFYVLST